MSQLAYLGAGSIANLADIAAKYGRPHVFLVHGKQSYSASGAEAAVNSIFDGYKVTHFSDFDANPKSDDVNKGAALFKKNKCSIIVAIGGGTAMDIAKSISLLASQPENIGIVKLLNFLYHGGEIRPRDMPLVAIPTTAGSGSEATPFAVVYVGKAKHSLNHKSLRPDYAIVDPQLTMSLLPNQTASTGMDALCQAIESYWNIRSTTASQCYAQEAIHLVMKHLWNAVNTPTLNARTGMAFAANFAGNAIAITTTTAPHAVSYPITSYFGIPHGHAVALTLPEMLLYNAGVTRSDALDPRGDEYVKKTIGEICEMLEASTPTEAAEKITLLMKSIGLQMRLSELGITEKDHDMIVQNGFNPARVRNNPRLLTEEALREMLRRIG